MTAHDPDYLKARRRRHIEMLIISALIIAAALALQVQRGGDGGGGADGGIGSGVTEHVAIRGADSLRLPPLCMSSELFGISCPGCGLTRSFVLLASGAWGDALAAHRIGWLLALAVLLQFPYRLAGLFGGPRFAPDPLGRWAPRLFGYAIIAALIGNWVLEQVFCRQCC